MPEPKPISLQLSLEPITLISNISSSASLNENGTNTQFIIEKIDEKEVISDLTITMNHSQNKGRITNKIVQQLNKSNATLGIISPPPKH